MWDSFWKLLCMGMIYNSSRLSIERPPYSTNRKKVFGTTLLHKSLASNFLHQLSFIRFARTVQYIVGSQRTHTTYLPNLSLQRNIDRKAPSIEKVLYCIVYHSRQGLLFCRTWNRLKNPLESGRCGFWLGSMPLYECQFQRMFITLCVSYISQSSFFFFFISSFDSGHLFYYYFFHTAQLFSFLNGSLIFL